MKAKTRNIFGAALLAAAALMLVIGTFQTTGFAAEPTKVTVKSKRGDVEFNHATHQRDIKCEKCHHNFKGADRSKPKCSDCHKAKADGDSPDSKTAYHNSCQKCHKAEKKGKPDTKAPTACNDCHKK